MSKSQYGYDRVFIIPTCCHYSLKICTLPRLDNPKTFVFATHTHTHTQNYILIFYVRVLALASTFLVASAVPSTALAWWGQATKRVGAHAQREVGRSMHWRG